MNNPAEPFETSHIEEKAQLCAQALSDSFRSADELWYYRRLAAITKDTLLADSKLFKDRVSYIQRQL